MSVNQAGKLRFYWIAFMTGVYTLWSCARIIIGSYVVKNYRPYIDKVLIVWARRLLGLIGVTTEVEGAKNIPDASVKRRLIVMCNHSSLYDIPISIDALQTSFRFVAKKELFNIPIFGSAIEHAEFISIDRKNHDQALKDLQRAKDKMLDGIRLWMAPEGTRSKDGRLSQFKRGGFHVAIDTQALILPIVVKDIHKVQAGDNLTLTLNQTVHVEICEPVDAAEYSTEQRKDLIKAVRSKMLIALGQNDD
ncbi:MAG: lysophospholipid acyltransferase family protein [Enterobacterales bacterium]|nr:lysophospholipid acyltransferase family protein [Enterobacterales bacterium]